MAPLLCAHVVGNIARGRENMKKTSEITEQIMHWFGENWGAAVCKISLQVEVPVDETCLHCNYQITKWDSGFVMFGLIGDGYCRELQVFHRDCVFEMMGIK